MLHTFGPPSPVVKLPNGDPFDTRQVRGTNQHAKNNNLQGSEDNPITVSSGTESNLKPDYSQPDDDWLAEFDHQCGSDIKKSSEDKIY